MRAMLIALAAAAAAAPAAAQILPNVFYDDLRARQEAAERQAVARSNELMALEAQMRTDRAMSELQSQRTPPPLPTLRYPSNSATATTQAKYPSVPDAALADSNRRVQAASRRGR